MARLLRIEYPGASYYVRNCGFNGKKIFESDEDYKAFIDRMVAFADSYWVKIKAYCLTSKEFHLYVHTPEGNISSFMKALTTSYIAYKRAGKKSKKSILKGRFYSLVVQDELYGDTVKEYIHLRSLDDSKLKTSNVKACQKFIDSYAWSSHAGFLAKTKRPKWLDVNLNKTQTKKYKTAIAEGIAEAPTDPYKLGSARYILADDKLTAKLKPLLTSTEKVEDIRDEFAEKVDLKSCYDMDDVIDIVADAYDVTSEMIYTKFTSLEARKAAIYAAVRYCSYCYTTQEIAEKFDVKVTSVHVTVDKFKKELLPKKNTAKMLKLIAKNILGE